MHDCKGKGRQFFALNFSIKEANFDTKVRFIGHHVYYSYNTRKRI